MKKQNFLKVVVFCLAMLTLAQLRAEKDSSYFYYYQGEKLYLSLNTQFMYADISFKESVLAGYSIQNNNEISKKMKKIFQIPHFVRKKIISSHSDKKSSVFATILDLGKIRHFQYLQEKGTLAVMRAILFVDVGCRIPPRRVG